MITFEIYCWVIKALAFWAFLKMASKKMLSTLPLYFAIFCLIFATNADSTPLSKKIEQNIEKFSQDAPKELTRRDARKLQAPFQATTKSKPDRTSPPPPTTRLA